MTGYGSDMAWIPHGYVWGKKLNLIMIKGGLNVHKGGYIVFSECIQQKYNERQQNRKKEKYTDRGSVCFDVKYSPP